MRKSRLLTGAILLGTIVALVSASSALSKPGKQPDTEMFAARQYCFESTSGDRNNDFSITMSTMHLGEESYCGTYDNATAPCNMNTVTDILESSGASCTFSSTTHSGSNYTQYFTFMVCRGSRVDMVNLSADLCAST